MFTNSHRTPRGVIYASLSVASLTFCAASYAGQAGTNRLISIDGQAGTNRLVTADGQAGTNRLVSADGQAGTNMLATTAGPPWPGPER